MRLPIVVAALACAAAVLPTAATAAPAGWDATPLSLPSAAADYVSIGPFAETAADGAIWAAWIATPPGESTQVLARRISPDGEVGALRVLSTTAPYGFSGAVALARVGADGMRVGYISENADRYELRRLTPSATGAPVTVYDRTVDDGDAAANGTVSYAPFQLLAGPGDTAWAVYRRLNGDYTQLIEAHLIAGDDTVGPVAHVSTGYYEAAAAVNPQDGSLVAVVPGQTQGLVTAVPVSTGATVGGAVVLRPSNPPANPPSVPGAGTTNPAIGIDASGIATTGWQLDVFGTPRIVEVRRLDVTTMTTLGGSPTSLNDGVAVDYNQYGPLIAVNPGGEAVAGWYETTSDGSTNNALLRAFAPGGLDDVGVIGPRQQLDEVGRAAAVADLVPGTSGSLITALEYGADLNSQAAGCRVATIDASTGGLVGAPEQLAPGNCFATGPSDDAFGLFAVWDGTDGALRLLRKPDAAPVCSDGGPVSVVAGSSVTLPLACTGWRPAREVVGTPGRGAVSAIDDGAGTATYTAGDTAGSDTVTFKAANAAGTSATATVAITVTPKPVVTPAGGGGTPGPGAGGAGAADGTAPVISAVTLTPASVTRSKLRSPTLRFVLSEAVTVTVTLERLAPGRRAKGRCVTKPAPKLRAPGVRCTSAVRVSRLTKSAPAGAAKLAVALKRATRALPAGSYRLTIAAKDAAGNAAKPASVKLRIR